MSPLSGVCAPFMPVAALQVFPKAGLPAASLPPSPQGSEAMGAEGGIGTWHYQESWEISAVLLGIADSGQTSLFPSSLPSCMSTWHHD